MAYNFTTPFTPGSSGSGTSPWSLIGQNTDPTSAILSGAAVGAGSLISANQQAAGFTNAANSAQTGINTSESLLNPYSTGGVPAMSALMSLYGLGGAAPNYSAFESQPGYKFQVQQGDQTIQRAANAAGNGFSSSTLGALDNYNAGLAASTYQSYLNNLYNLTGLGSGAAGQEASRALQGASLLEQAQIGQGTARANGINGAFSALGALSSGVSRLFNGGGGNGGNGSSGTPSGSGVAYDPWASPYGTASSGTPGTAQVVAPNGAALIYDNSGNVIGTTATGLPGGSSDINQLYNGDTSYDMGLV